MFLIALLYTLYMCGEIFFNYRMMFLWFFGFVFVLPSLLFTIRSMYKCCSGDFEGLYSSAFSSPWNSGHHVGVFENDVTHMTRIEHSVDIVGSED